MKKIRNIMSMTIQLLLVSFSLLAAILSMKWTSTMARPLKDYPHTHHEIPYLFSASVQEIDTKTTAAIGDAEHHLQRILAIGSEKRNFANTMQEFDSLTTLSDLAVWTGILHVLEAMNPDAAIREAAHQALLRVNTFWIDNISNNKLLYQAINAYAHGIAKTELLTAEQQYFIQETLADFERAGLNLSDDQLQHIKTIKKELMAHSLDFERAIATDSSKITVLHDELLGLDTDTINALERTEDGRYVLGVDYPTYTAVMEQCTVEGTRKQLYKAFSNRAYPGNDVSLKHIIRKRNQLAQLLGYTSYAHLDLADQMVKTPERAHEFLQQLITRAAPKEAQEIKMLTDLLASSITLHDNKIKPWDLRYIQTQYKQNFYKFDERSVADYFPMDSTIQGLLAIYRTFLGIEFEEQPIAGLWHNDVRLIMVYNQERTIVLGYLLLDLFPRPNKYSHAAHMGILPAYIRDGKRYPAVSVVVANFPQATATKPSLLMRGDVRTFFHEFGHALHSILGATSIVSFAGTNVKRDFVELPSQMLEEWLWDPQILKNISSHYITKQQLPDELIKTMGALKHFDTGIWIQTQAWYALLSLYYFNADVDKDPYVVMRALHEQYRPYFAFDSDNHMYASFGHLTGYGAKYYGYLWSKVFALDLFSEIKKQGLLNPEIGKKYVQEVIGKGGSLDPNQLLINFLGREPQQQAFLEDLGI